MYEPVAGCWGPVSCMHLAAAGNKLKRIGVDVSIPSFMLPSAQLAMISATSPLTSPSFWQEAFAADTSCCQHLPGD